MVLRKLAVALLSVGVMLPGLGHALAVKDVQTKSALGEPFHAEVELVEIGDLNADEIKVTLATQEDFERLGIDRVFFLSDLNFEVVLNDQGRSFIRIRSSKPVREPYLDFVVRIAWPGNLRLQEVTALLDPPLVSDTVPADVMRAVATADGIEKRETAAAAPVVAPAVVDAQPLPEAAAPVQAPPKPVIPPPTRTERPVAERPARQPEPMPQPDGYRVRAGDTMWKVAEQLRPNDGVTVTQTMIAIQRANPSAFIDNNVNQLRSGQVLRVPSEAQIREVSAQEAVASVREQADAWRSRQPAPVEKPALESQQVSAVAPVERKPAPVESKPEMKLLAAQTGKAGTAAAGKDQASSVTAADARKLDESRLKADAAKTEKEKAAAKVGALDAQVKANDQQLDVQNAKLAELQAKLKAQQEAAAAAPTPAATPAGVDTEAAEVAPEIAAAPLPAEPKPAPKKPVVQEQPPVEESSPLPLIAGGAGLLALLGGAFFFLKRRRDQQAEDEAMAELESMDEQPLADAQLDAQFAFGEEDRRGGSGSLASVLDESADDNQFPELDDVSPHANDRVLADPLEEVEQYLAFERYPQAAGFLVKSIAATPERADLRLKLLEVYARLDDHAGFAEQEAWFENAGDLGALGRAEELKASMSPVPVAKSADDYLEFEPSKPTAAAADDDLPSLEDLEMDFNATVSASSPSLTAIKDTDFDTSLDLSDEFSLDEPVAKAPAADAGLSLDEDLDFSLDAPAAAKPAADDGLSFELDEAAFDSKPAASDEGLDFALDDIAPEPAPAAAKGGFGELEMADFEPAPAQKAAVAATVDEDLSFSLDDLEAPAAAADTLDGDFSLDEAPAGTAGDFSFDDTLADAGIGSAVADFDATLKADAPAAVAEVAAPAAAPAPAGDLGMDDEFDFLADTDENATKLDLARAYIDMGDMDGARDILQEVLSEGNGSQKDEAKGLLAQVG